MIQKAKQFWASLPHQVQAGIIFIGTAVGTSLIHSIEQGTCFTSVCLRHDLASAVAAGVVATKTFYMTANRPVLQSQNPAQ